MNGQKSKELKRKQITLEDVQNRKEIRELIKGANDYLERRGYTEHGLRHVNYVSKTCCNILAELGYDKRECELAAIAGFLHDIGNSINRTNHGIVGATLAYPILIKMGMEYREILRIIAAIGNHEDEIGIPVSDISAALNIADKSDAHRTRVRKGQYDPFDIHDRVNYSIKKNYLVVDSKKRLIKLVIYMDESSSPMEYLEIYLSRMKLSERSAEFLQCSFELVINDVVINNHKSPKVNEELGESETNVSAE